MSKSSSGHFTGTTGSKKASKNHSHKVSEHGIIVSNGLDLREHPSKYKQMSYKKLKILNEKEANRTLTKEEYKRKEWQRRLSARRRKGIKDFWKRECSLIRHDLPTTRNWSKEQQQEILSSKQPKYNGKTLASHHTYSVAKFPHLANRGELIYPVTTYEHIQGWHGGNTKNSLPGIPIKEIKEF